MFTKEDLILILTIADKVMISGRADRMRVAALEEKCEKELNELLKAPASK